jgi:hypothetical protein
MRPLAIIPFLLILVSLTVDIASAQVPARVATPYALMDDETRTYIEGGVEVRLKGNGPTTGYAYLFSTRPHFLAEDLYLRLVVPPGYFISEPDSRPRSQPEQRSAHRRERRILCREPDRVPGRPSAESFTGDSAGGTLAYYLRGPKIFGVLPIEGQIRANPKYVSRSGPGPAWA